MRQVQITDSPARCDKNRILWVELAVAVAQSDFGEMLFGIEHVALFNPVLGGEKGNLSIPKIRVCRLGRTTAQNLHRLVSGLLLPAFRHAVDYARMFA